MKKLTDEEYSRARKSLLTAPEEKRDGKFTVPYAGIIFYDQDSPGSLLTKRYKCKIPEREREPVIDAFISNWGPILQGSLDRGVLRFFSFRYKFGDCEVHFDSTVFLDKISIEEDEIPLLLFSDEKEARRYMTSTKLGI